MTTRREAAMGDAPLLSVRNLTTVFDLDRGSVPAVDQASFDVGPGETLGLVGESGSGKSVTALSIMRLVQSPGRIAAGSIRFRGRDLMTLSEREMRQVRDADISLIFQEPMTALNPVFTIGDQIAEALLVHRTVARHAASSKVEDLLASASIPDPAQRARDYPHQLSGGLRQRVLIAMALACGPSLVIADEPTTALDATLQAQILDLLRTLKTRFDLSLLLITHDLGVVAEMADRVAIMYAGRIVETGPVREIFHRAMHPYTQGLLASIPGGAPGSQLQVIAGTVPPLGDLPSGCAFSPRCQDRCDRCDTARPDLYDVGPEHAARCFLHDAAAVGSRPSAQP